MPENEQVIFISVEKYASVYSFEILGLLFFAGVFIILASGIFKIVASNTRSESSAVGQRQTGKEGAIDTLVLLSFYLSVIP